MVSGSANCEMPEDPRGASMESGSANGEALEDPRGASMETGSTNGEALEGARGASMARSTMLRWFAPQWQAMESTDMPPRAPASDSFDPIESFNDTFANFPNW